MKKVLFVLYFFIPLSHIYPITLGVLPSDIKEFLEDYRYIKSNTIATTGKKILGDGENIPNKEEIRGKYIHDMFYVIANNPDKVIYIYYPMSILFYP